MGAERKHFYIDLYDKEGAQKWSKREKETGMRSLLISFIFHFPLNVYTF